MKQRRPKFCVLALLSGSILGCAGQTGSTTAMSGQAHGDRLKIAEAMFHERCKTAGEGIYETVDNVDGIFLMKVRPERVNYDDQYILDDPYGHDSTGERYIKTFFAEFYRAPSRPLPNWKPQVGYRYVEAIDPKDGKLYRYTGGMKNVTHTESILIGGDGKTTFVTRDFVIERILISDRMSRYGITYDDISTLEDRKYWIAGSSLKVIDLGNQAVVAERIGYLLDRGQGDTSGGRSPWLSAANYACPDFPMAPGNHPVQSDQTRNFVTKVLKPVGSR